MHASGPQRFHLAPDAGGVWNLRGLHVCNRKLSEAWGAAVQRFQGQAANEVSERARQARTESD